MENDTSITHTLTKTRNDYWVVGLGDGAGELPVLGRPATFANSRARVCCACSRCGPSGLSFFFFFFSHLSSFLISCLLGDS